MLLRCGGDVGDSYDGGGSERTSSSISSSSSSNDGWSCDLMCCSSSNSSSSGSSINSSSSSCCYYLMCCVLYRILKPEATGMKRMTRFDTGVSSSASMHVELGCTACLYWGIGCGKLIYYCSGNEMYSLFILGHRFWSYSCGSKSMYSLSVLWHRCWYFTCLHALSAGLLFLRRCLIDCPCQPCLKKAIIFRIANPVLEVP